jgi:hypothetical protein
MPMLYTRILCLSNGGTSLSKGTVSIVIFRLDPASGELTAAGHRVGVPTPVCVKVMVMGLR